MKYTNMIKYSICGYPIVEIPKRSKIKLKVIVYNPMKYRVLKWTM